MNRKPIRVFFRYDDFSATSCDVVDRGLIEVFGKHGLCCTFAVIPRVTEGEYRDATLRPSVELSTEKKELLSSAVRANVVDVALHGLNHRSNGLGMPHSEFRGLEYGTQADKIVTGKAVLEQAVGQPVKTFVPPWNTYDENTLAALKSSGLQCLSANRFGAAIQSEKLLRFLPITTELSELEDAVAAARRSSDADPIVGVLMHPYDFKESNDDRAQLDLEALDRKLSWVRSQGDLDVASVTELSTREPSLDIARYVANQPLRHEQLVPPFVRGVANTPYYSSTAGALAARRVRLGSSAFVYLLAAGAGWGFGSIVSAISNPLVASIAPWIVVLCVLALALRARKNGKLYFWSMVLIAGAIGCLAALL